MSLRKIKKQLAASAMAVLLSAGVGASGLLAAAPSVLAADTSKGSIMLDTASYVMAPGNRYDIGALVREPSGRQLSASEVRDLVSQGKLRVRDSRTGSIVDLQQLSNGNFRVTGKNAGTCWILYEIGGTHASVRIDVQNGARQHGSAVRNTSFFTQDVFPNSTPTVPNTPSQNTPTTPSPSNPGQTPSTPEVQESKVLVAYFSATNTTEGVAQRLADGMNAELYEITPATPYTSADLNYNNSDSRVSREHNDPNSRPAIAGSVENMGQYDIIFIGYPIWWGEAPNIVRTFMESYNFSGKTIIPFCTSASSGMGNSGSNLARLTSGAQWLSGRRLNGASQTELMNWVDSLNLDIEHK